jgi:hypothetical protein
VTIDATLDRFFHDRRAAFRDPARRGRPPPASHLYEDGTTFRIQVDATSAKAKRIAKLGTAPVSLTIQSEVPPYRYAVVYGSATLGPSTDPQLRTRVARRYFGRIAGDQYVQQENAAGRGEAAGSSPRPSRRFARLGRLVRPPYFRLADREPGAGVGAGLDTPAIGLP